MDKIQVIQGDKSRNLWNMVYTPFTLFNGLMPNQVNRTEEGAAAIDVTLSNTDRAMKESIRTGKLILFILFLFFVLFLEKITNAAE